MRRRNRATIDRYTNLQCWFSVHLWDSKICIIGAQIRVCMCIGFSVAKQKHARVRLCVRLTGIINTKDSGNELDSTEQTCLNTNQYHIFLLVNLFNQCANISANEIYLALVIGLYKSAHVSQHFPDNYSLPCYVISGSLFSLLCLSVLLSTLIFDRLIYSHNIYCGTIHVSIFSIWNLFDVWLDLSALLLLLQFNYKYFLIKVPPIRQLRPPYTSHTLTVKQSYSPRYDTICECAR